ncbi:YoaK family protein [Sphingobacterium lumbrici]|uniref:YoaK family protein n=1 Tax=Sphingobacterium lumbrici TaxID=2559600 RepID=UPI001129FA79|nr:YoaK family protein [Sphingobacterium lumbrici]
MFRHIGKGRTFSHNLRLASLLSAVAGMVNITGVLAFQTLTTNLTGHFAFFAEELFLRSYTNAWVYLLYVLWFLFGAFLSGLLMEKTSQLNPHVSYVAPVSLEIVLLVAVGILGNMEISGVLLSFTSLACMLLFAMGLQNALVTKVSQSVVRTTHLTGLFTDLGIELSRLVLRSDGTKQKQLYKSIQLKLAIISCFFVGGILGGFCHQHIALSTLFIPAGLLLFTLWYDQLLFRYYRIMRSMRKR